MNEIIELQKKVDDLTELTKELSAMLSITLELMIAEKNQKPESRVKIKRSYKKEITERIVNLREKGASYKEISKIFNRENVPTVSGIGVWHTQSIHRLIESVDEVKDLAA
jgi:hypothetical protein